MRIEEVISLALDSKCSCTPCRELRQIALTELRKEIWTLRNKDNIESNRLDTP
jgi:hypothetical protein